MMLTQGVLVGCAAVFVGLEWRSCGQISRRSKGGSTGSLRPGFTLIELLISLMVIGIVIVLVTSSLAGVRDGARTTKSMSYARSHAQLLNSYTQDYRDVFPWFMRLDIEETVVRCTGSDYAESGRFFAAAALWRVALADGYYDGRVDHPSFSDPRLDASPSVNGFFYPCVFVTHPDWWNVETRRVAPTQFMATRMADVRWPSAKVLITTYALSEHAPGNGMYGAGARAIVAACDGSALELAASDAVPDAGPDDGGPERYTAYIRPFVGLHTLNGVRGRDIP